ncbi:MAG TPA: hypothetical protein ENI98_11145 [Gammaproteobacteria bacterium]|nr:hypothetical protein [Gammaproteobacteria bacterium]
MAIAFFNIKTFNAKTRRREGRKGFMFGTLLGSQNMTYSHPYFSLRPSRLRVFALKRSGAFEFDFVSTEAAHDQ